MMVFKMLSAGRHAEAIQLLNKIKEILLEGDAINKQDEIGWTVLFYAVHRGDKAVVEMLIEAGANLLILDIIGQTAFHKAAMTSTNGNIIDLFLKSGVAIDIPDAKGKTALMHAIINRNERMADYLLMKGASVNCTDNKGRSSLHHAAATDNTDLLQKLVSAGANIQQVNQQGENALYCASESGKMKMVKALISLGINPTLRDEEGNNKILCRLERRKQYCLTTDELKNYEEITRLVSEYVEKYTQLNAQLPKASWQPDSVKQVGVTGTSLQSSGSQKSAAEVKIDPSAQQDMLKETDKLQIERS